jgi:hypothetical protein
MSARLPLTIPQGSTWRRRFELRNPDGSPMSLEGYTARMQYRSAHASAAVLLEATVANGRVTMGGSAGHFEIAFPAALTQSLEAPARGVYDIEIASAGGEVHRILEGDLRVSPEVTR